MLGKFIFQALPIFKAVFLTALAQGVIIWLRDSFGFDIPKLVASVLDQAANPTTLEAAKWLIAGFVGIGLTVAWEKIRGQSRFPKADLESWRPNEEMKIWHAGCLWEGFDPVYPVIFKHPAYSRFSMLLNAAETGELDLVIKKPDESFAHSIVSRKNLIEFAKKRGIAIPEFLKEPGHEHDLANQFSSGPNDEPKQESIPQSVFKDQDIKISEQIRDDQRVINKVFDGCTIYGPAVVWLMRTTIQHCGWHGTAESILLETKSDFAPVGSVIVKDCIFRNCQFKMVSIIAPKKLMPKIKAGFKNNGPG